MYWKIIGPHRFKLNNLMNIGGKFIYLDNKNPTQYNRICEKNVIKMAEIVITVVIIIIISHILAVVGPIYAYIFQDLRVTPMATELPFIDNDSDTGFLINLGQQCIVGFYSLLGNITIEMFSYIINNVITIIPDLIQLNLIDISNEIEIKGICLSSKIQLRNALVQIQDFDRYVFHFIFKI